MTEQSNQKTMHTSYTGQAATAIVGDTTTRAFGFDGKRQQATNDDLQQSLVSGKTAEMSELFAASNLLYVNMEEHQLKSMHLHQIEWIGDAPRELTILNKVELAIVSRVANVYKK